MAKSAPSPPPAPDYTGAAQAQGAANLQSGLQTAVLSNPNIISPYGNQTVTWNQDPNNPGGAPQATVTQSLTPQAQQTLDAQQKTQTSLANLANQGATNASGILGTPFQYSGPGINTQAPQAGQLATGVQQGPLDYGPRAGSYGLATYAPDLSGVAKMPVNAGTTGQQAILDRLNPQIQQQEQATAAQLANQGITQGSEAYNNAMRVQGQQENDLRTQAALQGIGLDLSANQQGYQQALGNAGLYNSAVAQNYGQGATSAGLYNSAAGQQFGEGLSNAQLQNSAVAQQFNQGLQGAQFQNQAAQQALQQQLALREQPINEITALESGSQIQTPQFQAYQGANVAAAPIFQAAQAQGNYGLQQYGIQSQNANAANQGLYSLAAAPFSAMKFTGSLPFSDWRLKRNIVRVGTHERGFGIYEYDIADRRERGVMAQEVFPVIPEAVAVHDSGYYMVDYARLAA